MRTPVAGGEAEGASRAEQMQGQDRRERAADEVDEEENDEEGGDAGRTTTALQSRACPEVFASAAPLLVEGEDDKGRASRRRARR